MVGIGDTKTHPIWQFFLHHLQKPLICYIPIPPMKGTRKLPFFPKGHWKDCGDPQSHAGRWAHLSSSASRHVLHRGVDGWGFGDGHGNGNGNANLGGGFKYFLCSSRKLGKIPILTHIFQMGWFNHQPAIDSQKGLQV